MNDEIIKIVASTISNVDLKTALERFILISRNGAIEYSVIYPNKRKTAVLLDAIQGVFNVERKYSLSEKIILVRELWACLPDSAKPKDETNSNVRVCEYNSATKSEKEK